MIQKQNYISKVCLLILFFTFSFSKINAQLTENSKIFITFKNIDGEVNVDAEDAKDMLKSYIFGKTTCLVVETQKEADFIFQLSVIEKNMGNRKGQIDIVNNQTNKIIFQSQWLKSTTNAFNGYSGSRGVIGKIIKNPILDAFPEIRKEPVD